LNRHRSIINRMLWPTYKDEVGRMKDESDTGQAATDN